MFGHTGQLGPIDWGEPFWNLVDLHRAPRSSSIQTVFDLHTNLRSESVSIVTEADRVLQGSSPRSSEHVRMHFDSAPGGEDMVTELIRLQQGSPDSPCDVVAIVATNGYKPKFGVQSLYEIYFRLMNRSRSPEPESMHRMWCGRWMLTNDRVMIDDTIHTKRENIGVSIGKGTMGIVESAEVLGRNPKVTIKLDLGGSSTIILTTWEHVGCVAPGSIISGHKAQGCEWKHVLVMIPDAGPDGPWCRNWVYMAMTRAKQNLQLYVRGGASMLDRVVAKVPPRRKTHLRPLHRSITALLPAAL